MKLRHRRLHWVHGAQLKSFQDFFWLKKCNVTRNKPFVCTYNAVLNVTLNTLSISGKGCHHEIEAIEVEFLRKFYSLGIYMSQNFWRGFIIVWDPNLPSGRYWATTLSNWVSTNKSFQTFIIVVNYSFRTGHVISNCLSLTLYKHQLIVSSTTVLGS